MDVLRLSAFQIDRFSLIADDHLVIVVEEELIIRCASQDTVWTVDAVEVQLTSYVRNEDAVSVWQKSPVDKLKRICPSPTPWMCVL